MVKQTWSAYGMNALSALAHKPTTSPSPRKPGCDTMECTNEKRETDNELVVNISLQDPIMYAMINGYINLNNQLSSDNIDIDKSLPVDLLMYK